jgi:uncharacterized protein YbbK (DUF523 family)/uncharacterized protein YbgA (DUF1722 family)
MRARPILCMSLCLGDAPVRYDGAAIRDPFAKRLAAFVDLRPVCPELEIGLGVPRDPIRIERGRLVQPTTGLDLTERMRRFAAGFLDGLGEVDGFLLKSRSPSCAAVDAKLLPSGRGAGLFARAALARHPHVPVEDERRLADARLREHFLTRLFATAELREVGSPDALRAFHARHRLLLAAWPKAPARTLDRLAEDPGRRPWRELKSAYRAAFARALSEPPRPGAVADELERALRPLMESHRRAFRSVLRRCRSGRLPGPVSAALLRAGDLPDGLAGQSLLDPFPGELAGSGR